MSDIRTTFPAPCGPITGWSDGTVVRATGIPYGTAARFAAPTAAPDRTDPLDATTWSPVSPQPRVPRLEKLLGAGAAPMPADEDCLRVSITMPADAAPDAALPVMVFVHGGSYVAGGGDNPLHDPARLVAEQGVVAVNVTYRLGLLGFLGDGTTRPANLGLLDIRLALAWVRRNIAAFGGDPSRVTAFGESAGADALAHLLATSDVASLVDRVILQSTPLGIRAGRAAMSAAMFAEAADLTAETPLDEILERQPRVSAAAGAFGLTSAMPFGVQYGHAPLPDESGIEEAWEASAGIPLLVGFNSNESRLFIPDLPKIGALTRVPVIGPLVMRAVDRALTRKVYAAPAKELATRRARAGGDAWLYEISWGAPGNSYRAAHTIDLALLLGNEASTEGSMLLAGATWAEIDEAGRGVRQAWADFARGELADAGRLDGIIRWERVAA
ncbi:carboxylesterase family protein [Salinibacterium sp. ZJ70]|uniref:carboxylesterase family protein n=1 Tax=Salinibacterium sp. ZJ70 TaxID=2708084 RepID=UPI0014232171|nr:carboxylesterase family protein [Salinibacterium sp. ZJ70]